MVGENIREIMKKKGFSQKELAVLCGIPESTLSRFVNDECEPKASALKAIATVLGVTIDELFYGQINVFPNLQLHDFIEVHSNKEMRFFLTDEWEQFDGIIHPDEDFEFVEEDVSEVWRQVDNDTFKCIYRKNEKSYLVNSTVTDESTAEHPKKRRGNNV